MKYHFIRIVSFSVVSLWFVVCMGCAATPFHYLSKARHEFANKEYDRAVNDLQIAAEYKDPHALYALGYMYYYGLGVQANPYIARIYMLQAANLYFPPAMEAVTLLQQWEVVSQNMNYVAKQHPSQRKYPEDLSQQKGKPRMPNKNHPYFSPHRMNNTRQRPLQQHVLMLPEPKVTHVLDKDRDSIVNYSNTKKYTIQLFSTLVQKHAYHFIQQNSLAGYARVIKSYRNNKIWYDVVFGHYFSIKQAKMVESKLPRSLILLKPWVRPI